MQSQVSNEQPAEITLQNTVDRTRRVKTTPRNTPMNSYDSLGHCESAIKEVENQIRVLIFHTLKADRGTNVILQVEEQGLR